MDDQRQLEELLGHAFRRPELLVRSLTHSSLAHEAGDGAPHNEQYEFLGDSVLGFLVSALLFESFPDADEGRLSKMKAHLVSAAHLYSVAEHLNLGRFLLLGRGEEKSGGRNKRALLVDAVEALIAGLYLDGGIPAASQFVSRWVVGGELQHGIEAFPSEDYKSALQEYVQARQIGQPRYRVVEERGPEHRKVFVVEVRMGADRTASAEGPTKKGAEQAAARTALAVLRQEDARGRQLDGSAAGKSAPEAPQEESGREKQESESLNAGDTAGNAI
jgi:ribonuclease III